MHTGVRPQSKVDAGVVAGVRPQSKVARDCTLAPDPGAAPDLRPAGSTQLNKIKAVLIRGIRAEIIESGTLTIKILTAYD